METLSVRCNHCGAPLVVGKETNFVTCQFCNCQLQVKRTDSSVFTEEIAEIAQTTRRMAGSLEVIELQNDIERLDREWIASNPTSYDKHGRPTGQTGTGGAVVGMVFAIIFALVCFGMASQVGSFGGGGISLLPVGMGIFAIGAGIVGVAKANHHETRRSEYERRRAAMLARLNGLRQ